MKKLILSSLLVLGISVFGQDTVVVKNFICDCEIVQKQDTVKKTDTTIGLSTDIVSQFMFRGVDVGGGRTTHIQPVLYYGYKNLEIGAWGSYGIDNNYQEIDLYTKYTYKAMSLQYINYNIPIWVDEFSKSMVFGSDESVNIGEAILTVSPTKYVPIKTTVAFNLYDESNFQNSLTYLELGLPIKLEGKTLDLFVGGYPYSVKSFNQQGLVNIGGTMKYNLDVIKKITTPISITIGGNPQSKKAFFVVGLTF